MTRMSMAEMQSERDCYAIQAAKLVDLLRRQAQEQNAEHPQYDGHFKDYVLVRIRRDIRTKMGLAFRKDELTIMQPPALPNVSRDRTVYSFRNKVDTLIHRNDVREL